MLCLLLTLLSFWLFVIQTIIIQKDYKPPCPSSLFLPISHLLQNEVSIQI
jgi:hypothetical protein